MGLRTCWQLSGKLNFLLPRVMGILVEAFRKLTAAATQPSLYSRFHWQEERWYFTWCFVFWLGGNYTERHWFTKLKGNLSKRPTYITKWSGLLLKSTVKHVPRARTWMKVRINFSCKGSLWRVWTWCVNSWW